MFKNLAVVIAAMNTRIADKYDDMVGRHRYNAPILIGVGILTVFCAIASGATLLAVAAGMLPLVAAPVLIPCGILALWHNLHASNVAFHHLAQL